MKKNDIIEIHITDIGVNGEGVGRYDDMTCFVKDALPGDTVRAVITKVKKGYAFAKMLEILQESSCRVKPACSVASRCGGCQLMQLDYKEQLKIKAEKVRNNLIRIGGIKNPPMAPIIGMETEMPLHFRNKVQFPIGRSKDGRTVTGFYAGRTHYIVETDSCPVSAPCADKLLARVRSFADEYSLSVYDEEIGRGLLRHVLIRNGSATGQVMLCLVINGDSLGKCCDGSSLNKKFAEYMLAEDLAAAGEIYLHSPAPELTSICLNINKEKTNVILGQQIVPLYGPEYIEDKIGTLTFRISPLAFFQVNSVQTERLYGKALEYAALSGTETVWDLYCGTGTISLFLARKAKKIYGVEIIQAAIDNANENARINGISNAEFFCGKSEEIFPAFYGVDGEDTSHTEKEHPDVVVLDPPRKGCDISLLEAILEVKPERIVYVSCDSATLARDIKILSEEYKLKEATPTDMFAHTIHVEVVSLLQRMSNTRRKTITLDVEMEDYYRIKNETEVTSDAKE